MYSPIKPSSNIMAPPKNTFVAISELYPRGTDGSTSLLIIDHIVNINPDNAQSMPLQVAMRKGFIEKAVKPFIHSHNNLESV